MSEVFSIVPFDLHVHSGQSHDGTGSVMEYCERAIQFDMKAIGLCEHVDLDPRDPVSGLHDYASYVSEVEEARERLADRLIICMGAEVGYVPGVEGEIAAHLDSHSYDYVVGSVHSIFEGEFGVSEEYEALETFAKYEFREVYEAYFHTVQRMVVSGLFDVVGHLDLVQRFGVNYQTKEMEWGVFYGHLRRILEGAIKREMALEINTSGLRQAPHSPFPDPHILALYAELTGKSITIGSDAHQPADLGAGVPSAIKLARRFGLIPQIFKGRLPGPVNY